MKKELEEDLMDEKIYSMMCLKNCTMKMKP
jgi:hypothetical protein